MKSFKIILITVVINAIIAFLLFSFLGKQKVNQHLAATPNVYDFQEGISSRWISFENPKGEKGGGGKENQGWKGHPYDYINPGEKKVIFDVEGSGVMPFGHIERIVIITDHADIELGFGNQGRRGLEQ